MGLSSLSLGQSCIASGEYSFAEGFYTTASGLSSHAEGTNTIASGMHSHAEGLGSKAVGFLAAHAEGMLTEASGAYSHSEGYLTIASEQSSHAEGASSHASGAISHAEGLYTVASGYCSHAANMGTIAAGANQTAIGRYNVPSSSDLDALLIGRGSFDNYRDNAFRFNFLGQAFGTSWATTGADFSELFEWEDGNVNEEDRVGFFVTLIDDKIRIINNLSEEVIGVVSSVPSIIGDSEGLAWKNKFIKDDFGRIEYEWIDTQIEIDKVLGTKLRLKEHVPKLNPNYNIQLEYIPRTDRPEWSAIGLIGKLIVFDDGTCEVNKYCTANVKGIATKSDSGYRVLKRISVDKIQILFK